MYRNYKKLIKETQKTLKDLEKEHRNSVVGTRMRLLSLLKSGEAKTVSKASSLIHYSRGHCQRWLKVYKELGLKALLEPEKSPPGRPERMTEEAWEALNEAMHKGEIASYPQARLFLKEQGVSYKDDSSILKLFRRHQVKGKTGRPVHEKADLEAQEAFKKTSLSS